MPRTSDRKKRIRQAVKTFEVHTVTHFDNKSRRTAKNVYRVAAVSPRAAQLAAAERARQEHPRGVCSLVAACVFVCNGVEEQLALPMPVLPPAAVADDDA